MKRQMIRKFLLTVSLLLFPVTLYYFSPALIISAGLQGIINGSFIVFILLFILSIPFGRLFCSYLCPAGGLQECSFAINCHVPRQGWRNNIKYVIWSIWILTIVFCYFHSSRNISVNFFFETQNGISLSGLQSYIIYYGVILLIFIPAVFSGKRTFCHYFCWMAPFMVLGIRLRRFLHLPGLHIQAKSPDRCISCNKCSQNCPMGLDVEKMVKSNCIYNSECIQCGACVDNCPRGVIAFGMILDREHCKPLL